MKKLPSTPSQRINLVFDAFNSGTEELDSLNLDLIRDLLHDPIAEVREFTRWLLQQKQTAKARLLLRNYLPYSLMKRLQVLTGKNRKKPNYFAISSEKKALLTNCYSYSRRSYTYDNVNIWNLETGERIDSLPLTHEHLSTTEKGEIIVGTFQHIIQIEKPWQKSRDSQKIFGTSPHNSDLGSLSISQDGKILACGELGPDRNLIITVWDLEKIELIHFLSWKPEPISYFKISQLIISPDNSLLLSWEESPRLQIYRLWSLKSGKLLNKQERYLARIGNTIALLPDGRYLASGTSKKGIQVWDLFSNKTVYANDESSSPTALTPDGKVLAYWHEFNGIELWDLDIKQKICSLPDSELAVEAICLSQNREWVVTYDCKERIKIYGLKD